MPLNVVGITILNVDAPSEPVRLPSQVAPSAQASAAWAGASAGAAASSNPDVASTATMRRDILIFIGVLIYGSNLEVGAPGLNVVFLAVPEVALVAVMM